MLGILLRRIVSTVLTMVIFFTALFQAGLPRNVQMPEADAGEYGQWVDPFIGTGGYPWVSGMLFPGATTPFGMVRLSPDTTFPGGINPFTCGTAGYYYGHNYLWGFSHTRLSGTGATDMGHFRVTPAVGDTDPAKRLSNPIIFSHEKETASPGYYAVYLPGIDCMAEMTAATHTGVHRYTFGSGKDAHIFIDATSFLRDGRAEEGKVTINPEAREVTGEGRVFTAFTGRYGGLKGYFAARFDTPFESFAVWNDGERVEGATVSAGSGKDAGADINFGNIKGRAVEIKIGISFVSLENARQNLDAEAGLPDFNAVRNAAKSTWETALSKIKIQTPDDDIKTIFYTALYHTMIMPTDFTDVNGEYLGFKKQVGIAEDFTYRTDMSLWDTFRTAHPLYNLIAPDIQRDCLKSLVRMARVGGTLPRWPSGGGYTGSMFGSPADMVVTESYLKGIRDFEAEEAFGYMKKTSMQTVPGADNRPRVDEYNTYGYCLAKSDKDSVSRTLEYAWADGSIALMAEALGKNEDAEYFAAKSQNYKNLWNPVTKYFQARFADGSWQKPLMPGITSYYDEILPVKVSDAYCEGSPRQWRWSVPHDPQGLIDLFGKKYFVRELDRFMLDASKNRAAIDPGAGYWQGNQHDIHAPYLFNEAGRPDLTQKWVRWALAERHSTDVDGLDGNDDGGTLSAWYVFSAMGFYPVAGTDLYWHGSPNIERAEVNLGNGKTLTVIAKNQSPENIYVQNLTVNGQAVESPSFAHSLIAEGGTMVFTMGPNAVR
ncbi:MAG: GH92 family glycosyl hydrolase [Acutalibacteraceae bacterium]|jgi:predicted alpha-1,2-mannosidase